MASDISGQAELEERLREYRREDPTRRPIHVVNDGDVDPARADAAVATARAKGLDESRRCTLDGPAPDEDESFGFGGLGLRGAGGGGTGEGTIGLGNLGNMGREDDDSGDRRDQAGASGRAPLARLTRIRVDSDAMSDQVIRRIASRHRNEIQRCREMAHDEGATMDDTLVVRVAIGDEGAVRSSEIVESTGSDRADACVVQSHRGWTFPSGDGETVATIHYRAAHAD